MIRAGSGMTQMRLGLCFAGIAISLAACSEAKVEQARRDFGCGPIDGIAQIASRKQPAYVVVGEVTETNEAPAAFAEIACNLAASGKLFVGVSEYVGGPTDAETRMRERIDALIAKGAPITIGVISDESREWNLRDRTGAEKRWADSIIAKMAASGASRALLLVAHTDARDGGYARSERFAGYDPMPMHLPQGQVMSLEIGTSPAPGLTAPTVRVYPQMTDGFHGQVALASLTRPAVALVIPNVSEAIDQHARSSGMDLAVVDAILRTDMPRGKKVAAVADYLQSLKSAETKRMLGPLGSYTEQKLAEGLVETHEQLGQRFEELRRGNLDTDVRLEMPKPIVNLPDFKVED